MLYLFDVWDGIAARVKSSKHGMLLFDYDGTLTPIVDNPDEANLSQETRGLLKALGQRRGFTVVIISGRALSDLRSRVGVHSLTYSGNHGLEIEGPELRFVHPVTDEVKSALKTLSNVLGRSLNTFKGVLVEDKGLSLSVHYRLVEREQETKVKNIFERVVGVARGMGLVRTASGKKVYEVRPAVRWHKGEAVKLMLERQGKSGKRSGLLPVYVGDDQTDEDAFKVVEELSGISIRVGDDKSDSLARYCLKSQEEVPRLMEALISLAEAREANEPPARPVGPVVTDSQVRLTGGVPSTSRSSTQKEQGDERDDIQDDEGGGVKTQP